MKLKTVELALQGGGSHGAFTWGVLDRLLEDERIEIVGVSGASAGAANAVVFASGLSEAGREGARVALRRFWMRIADAGALGALFGNWGLAGSPWQVYFESMTRLLSPRQLNPFDLNPLRDILAASVDFARVRAAGTPRLFVSATNVRTGRLRVFRHHELSADAVMASACLPQVFRAVELEGEAYWDGGYLGNPPLFPLIVETPAHDLIVVQINPVLRPAIPASAADIVDRVNEISFNSSLVREMHSLALLKELLGGGAAASGERAAFFRQIEELRVHRIHGDSGLAQLGAPSKLNTTRSFLVQVFELGRGAADAWLTYNFKHLGRVSTLDLAEYLA